MILRKLGVLVLFLAGASFAAAETSTKPKFTKPPISKGELVLGLSKAECEGLGGTVLPGVEGNPEKCPGAYCSTTDKNDVIRLACINKKDK